MCRCVIANIVIAHNRHFKWSLTTMRSLNYVVCRASYAPHFQSESRSELFHTFCFFDCVLIRTYAVLFNIFLWVRTDKSSSADLMTTSRLSHKNGVLDPKFNSHTCHNSFAFLEQTICILICSQLRHVRSLACFVLRRRSTRIGICTRLMNHSMYDRLSQGALVFTRLSQNMSHVHC